MKQTLHTFLAIVVLGVFSESAISQQYSCSDMDWPEQIASIYENIEPACIETTEIDGSIYGRFQATFLSEHAGEVTLRFGMPDGNTVIQTFLPPEDFRVNVDGKQMAFHELSRGQTVTLLIPTND